MLMAGSASAWAPTSVRRCARRRSAPRTSTTTPTICTKKKKEGARHVEAARARQGEGAARGGVHLAQGAAPPAVRGAAQRVRIAPVAERLPRGARGAAARARRGGAGCVVVGDAGGGGGSSHPARGLPDAGALRVSHRLPQGGAHQNAERRQERHLRVRGGDRHPGAARGGARDDGAAARARGARRAARDGLPRRRDRGAPGLRGRAKRDGERPVPGRLRRTAG
mmetsp:Transcript_18789/g.61305  ORF Transcript_18789/g.61305 Transcript_18789/m.61305 type:complete len:224 (-) Transcript_18789:79-750(-)